MHSRYPLQQKQELAAANRAYRHPPEAFTTNQSALAFGGKTQSRMQHSCNDSVTIA